MKHVKKCTKIQETGLWCMNGDNMTEEKFYRFHRDAFQKSKIVEYILRHPNIPPLSMKIFILWINEPEWRHPTKKEYARRLNAHPEAVQKAYRILQKEKILEDVSHIVKHKDDGRIRVYQYNADMLSKVFKKFKPEGW